VIEIAGNVPVLVRGGDALPMKRFKTNEEFDEAGAAGIVYGRNIIQHPKPAAMTKALMNIVHQNAKASCIGMLK